MLKDYKPLMHQAEIEEVDNHINLYREAIEMLSQNPVNRLSSLEQDLSTIIQLLIITIVEQEKLPKENLLLGTYCSFKETAKHLEILNQYLSMKNEISPNKDDLLNIQGKIEDLAYSFKQGFKENYQYQFKTDN